MTETRTAPATCTVVVSATTGRCGAEAVYVLPGGKFAECAEHFAGEIAPARTAVLAAGTLVRVTHIGAVKVGTVVAATAKRIRVEVPVGRGAKATTKVITVAAEAVEVVR